MERDSRLSRRRLATLRKGPENRDMIVQMKAFCTTTVATGVQVNIIQSSLSLPLSFPFLLLFFRFIILTVSFFINKVK
ncbi:unnamed protein product [Brugia timori]|uniref:Uncharacterized protein n=1 Tax=Brugia timori TaxID=42155 RepID=A0A0R3RDR7_9BILA|nr:unnamed protein product [Brugia timori]